MKAESHMKNEKLYSTTGQQLISNIIKRRQHQFNKNILFLQLYFMNVVKSTFLQFSPI